MDSTVESLDGNKVKLHVAVPAAEFDTAIDAAFRKLAREVRIPGFRPGKAPRRILEARLGGELAREQALKDAIPDYYVAAVDEHAVDVIAAPEIEIVAGEDDGDVEFDAVVEVRPEVRLVGYDGLRVEVPYEAVTDETVDGQIDALRERFADLVTSEHPAVDDAFVTIDVTGSIDGEVVDGLSAQDVSYRVGSGGIVPALDGVLRGTRPGAIIEVTDTLPERYGDHAGDEVALRVVVKDVLDRVLPEVTDEWASEASEFDTLEELRADIRQRMELIGKVQAQMAVRDKVLEALAELVPVEPPESLVDQEARRRLESMAHDLSHRGATLEQYVAATGREPQAFVDEVRQGAGRAVLADLGIRAVVAQEAISATDEEFEAEVARIAERTEQKPDRVRRDLEKQGLTEAVRFDIARGKALEFLVEHAIVVDEAGAPVDLTLPPGAEGPDEGAEGAETSETASSEEPSSETADRDEEGAEA